MAVTSCDFYFHYTADPGKAQPLGAAWTAPSLCLHSQKSAPESVHLAQVPALFCGKYRLCGLPRPEEGPGRLEDHGQGIYRGLRLRPSIGKQTFPPCVGAEKSFVLCRPAYTGGREYPQAVTADSGKTRRLDHHLTTSSSQPVLCIVFYVPTSFYNHQKQRRKLCTLHNFRRCIIVFTCLSQFSDQTTTFNWTMDN